jgi:hypothetical protein
LRSVLPKFVRGKIVLRKSIFVGLFLILLIAVIWWVALRGIVVPEPSRLSRTYENMGLFRDDILRYKKLCGRYPIFIDEGFDKLDCSENGVRKGSSRNFYIQDGWHLNLGYESDGRTFRIFFPQVLKATDRNKGQPPMVFTNESEPKDPRPNSILWFFRSQAR